jgi:poly(3-hydroxyoctanoate) depolymerase
MRPDAGVDHARVQGPCAPARAERVLFLPGAGGDPTFWQPVDRALDFEAERTMFGWPGFGAVPADPAVRGIDDLVARVVERIDRPVAIVAQSMGGVVAVRAALERPCAVARLVLCATSGGIDVAALGASDWRGDWRRAMPDLPTWFVDDRSDLSDRLGGLRMPVLLVWGDRDPISPLAVGERLRTLLPDARLTVIEGGAHDLAVTHAPVVARAIDAFLVEDPARPPADGR